MWLSDGSMVSILIVGCGYTGSRVARRLLRRGLPVVATSRKPNGLEDLECLGAKVTGIDFCEPGSFERVRDLAAEGCRVLISVPTIQTACELFDPTSRIVEALGDRPSRVMYLSTTAVYGRTAVVDEHTAALPATHRQQLRLEAERSVIAREWSHLILRPAAIYGPGRGVHQAMIEGTCNLMGDGSNLVSRIHVEDLAALTAEGLLGDISGVYPVADDEACTSREIALFCSRLLGVPMPKMASGESGNETRHSNRRVDGRAIRRLLGVELRYPSYRTGIPSALRDDSG